MKTENFAGKKMLNARFTAMLLALLPNQNRTIARKQFGDTANTLPIFLIFQICAAFAACQILERDLAFARCKVWLGVVVATSVGVMLVFRKLQANGKTHNYDSILKASPLGSSILAVLWCVPIFFSYTIAQQELRFLLFALVIMVMVIGASSIVRLPLAAILFVLTISTAISSNASAVVGQYAFIGSSFATIFALGLICIIVLTHEDFLRHSNIEIENSKQNDVIKLLLNDFESGTSDWLWETDAAGKLVYFSPRLACVFGKHIDDMYGEIIADMLECKKHANANGSLASMMADKMTIIDQTYVSQIGGIEHYWQISARPLQNEHEQFSGYRGVGRDITNQFNNDAQIKKAKDEAERANATKSQFLAVISHELRTPINAIVGFSEILNSAQGENLPSSNRREYLTTIQESANHLQGLINDILDATRIERGSLQLDHQQIDAAELVETAVKICRSQATRSNVSLIVRVIDDVLINGDLTRLKQVVLNLVSNAIKFSPEGGVVNIDMQPSHNLQLVISIRDAGVGIKLEDIERVFEPFAQGEQGADRKFGGMGLGLAIARKIARLHGGEVTLDGKLGIGTQANIILPPDRVRWPKPRSKSTGSVAA